MRQAVEAQVLNPHSELGEHGLRQILTDVIEEVRKSVNQDIDGAEILHSLLNATWLQSLLKVYACLQRYVRDSPAPVLDGASGLSFQLLMDIRALSSCSEEAKELYRLLRQPHLQEAKGGLVVSALPAQRLHTDPTVEEEEDLMAFDEKCVEADEEAFESEELREDEGDFSSSVEGIYFAGFRRSLRLCRRRSHNTTPPSCHTRCPVSCDSALSSPYEEVVRYHRNQQDAHRLIALLGPSGVGVNELRRRLIEMNPNIFQGAVPHTTRAPKGHEESGREYYFTSRQIFDDMMIKNRFLEHGEYKGSLYGTSIESEREVSNGGKICVIDIEPNAIPAVRSHELKGYIIYVKPPPLERLRETRQDAFITTNYYVNRPFKDEDFQEMEDAARRMESLYCQFFDHVIVNDELQDSCVQLLTAVRKAQDEPQWVPASWIRPTAQP